MITATGVAVPEDMAKVLELDPAALDAFQALRPDDQLQYVNWLVRPGASARSDRLSELAGRIAHHKPRPAPRD